MPVVAGVNAGASREVVQYSREAEALGAAGMLVAPPYYSLPRPDEVLEHVRLVDRAVGIPIMLYNYPGRTGVDMKPEYLERLAELKNVRYVKESTGETARMSEIIRRCGDRLQVFCGCDSVVLESFVLGAVGWVAGIANICAAEHIRLYELLPLQGLCGGPRVFLPPATVVFADGEQRQVHAVGQGRRGPRWPRRRPPAAAAAAADAKKKLNSSRTAMESTSINQRITTNDATYDLSLYLPALLMAGIPQLNSALYHRIRFLVGDPVAYVQFRPPMGRQVDTHSPRYRDGPGPALCPG